MKEDEKIKKEHEEVSMHILYVALVSPAGGYVLREAKFYMGIWDDKVLKY